MRSRIKRGTWAAISGSALVWATGCSEPTEIVPVAPPGMAMQRIPAVPVGDPQAIGETGNAGPVNSTPKIMANAPTNLPTPVGQPIKTASGLEYVTVKEGTGPTAKPGDSVEFHYTGTLLDGTKFDSSRDKNVPLATVIATGGMIRGVDEGVPGMKVGEQRRLTIPSDLGYGDNGAAGGKIPGGATLIFDVELMSVKSPETSKQMDTPRAQ